MARQRSRSPFRRLVARVRGGEQGDTGRLYRQIEEKRQKLADATQQWVTLLREMEHNGESGDPRYEQYYQAYLQARQQEQRAELELFNLRQGLIH